VGDHGSTFGGNPLAASAGCVVLDTVARPAFLKEITRKGKLFEDIIKGWNKSCIKEVRGRGLMLGVVLDRDAWPILEAACKQGLLLLSAGQKVLRFLPPYVISDDEIRQGLAILEKLL
jgi:acetylornithine/N-succinyldiaminopimelate aminotransferase